MFNFAVFLSTTITFTMQFLILPAFSLSGCAFWIQRLHNLLRDAYRLRGRACKHENHLGEMIKFNF